MAFISIITVSFNSSRTISRTIESVLNQTYSNYEYIIVDGNSSDGTQDIIKTYENDFNNHLKWISEPDHGIYQAMNKGLRMASGDIIGIVNSDDWLEPYTLGKIAEIYNSTSAAIRNNTLYCGAIRFHYVDNIQLFPVNKKMFYRCIKKKSLKGAWHPATFVPKEVYKKVGFFDENYRVIGDVDFIYRCYKENCNFVFIDEVLSNMSDGGISTKGNNTFKEDRIYILLKYGASRWEYHYSLLKGDVFLYIKSLLPSWVIKKYRDLIY